MEAPLRCQKCGCIINKKPGAKTPKNCSGCRHEQQEMYRERYRTRVRPGNGPVRIKEN